MQEFLASFGVQIDESGLNRLQQALQDNRELAEDLAAAFDHARSEVEAFFHDLSGITFSGPDVSSSARISEDQPSFTLPLSLDFTKATQELSSFLKIATKSFKLNADASAVVSAGRNALSQLQNLFASTILPLQANVTVTEIRTPTGNTDSGVRNTPANTVNMLSQSAAPANTINTISQTTVPTQQLQASSADTTPLSALPELFASAKEVSTSVVHQNTTHNVSAPVSIQVEASGSDPEAVGRSVYDVAEQYLLRTLKTYG